MKTIYERTAKRQVIRWVYVCLKGDPEMSFCCVYRLYGMNGMLCKWYFTTLFYVDGIAGAFVDRDAYIYICSENLHFENWKILISCKFMCAFVIFLWFLRAREGSRLWFDEKNLNFRFCVEMTLKYYRILTKIGLLNPHLRAIISPFDPLYKKTLSKSIKLKFNFKKS